MPRNDEYLLNGIIEQYPIEGSVNLDIGERFELFCLEQILKSYDLSGDELKSGHTDGRDDGGIDGCYLFINGHLCGGDEGSLPKSGARMEVFLINCKHHNTFKEATLNTIVATLQELFDLSLSEEQLAGSYNKKILEFRRLFSKSYRKLAIQRPVLSFRVVYASRGNTDQLGESVSARADQIERILLELFSEAKCDFDFMGAPELVELFRQTKTFTLEIPFSGQVSGDVDGHIILCKLKDYFNFITDENGNLRRYLLDSNVRDYLGENKVNLDITNTLTNNQGPDFWWLNNGVTILATKATITGKSMVMQDIQIINGLQTSETIFNHFSSGSEVSADKSIFIKVVVSEDTELRDQIIVASNNQSTVEQSALRATDKIQRDIDDVLERAGWYYERRKNYYLNVGRAAERIVNPMYVAGAVTALIMKNPFSASRLRSRFMRSDNNYSAVFSSAFPIEVWPVLVSIHKEAEAVLNEARKSSSPRGERFLRTWRGLISLLAVAKRFGTFAFSAAQLANITLDERFREELLYCWNFCESKSSGPSKPSSTHMRDICDEFATLQAISNPEVIGRRSPSNTQGKQKLAVSLSSEFLDQVDMLLPHQPWQTGVHYEVAEKLGCRVAEVSAAIQQLISLGRRKNQRDGVVLE